MNFREFKDKVKDYPLFGSDVLDILAKDSRSLRNQLSRWQKKKLIIPLRRGMYTLRPEERGVGLSAFFLGNNLYSPSYISLESALSYYQLIPERVSAVTSITTKKTQKFINSLGAFIYHKASTRLFFGITKQKDEHGFNFLIAEPEKALLDYLYLNLSRVKDGDRDFFKGSLRLQNKKSFDMKKLLRYSKKFAIKKLDRLLETL